jgi:hypothetical protein
MVTLVPAATTAPAEVSDLTLPIMSVVVEEAKFAEAYCDEF